MKHDEHRLTPGDSVFFDMRGFVPGAIKWFTRHRGEAPTWPPTSVSALCPAG